MTVSGLVKNVQMCQKILMHRGRCNIFMDEAAGPSETSVYFCMSTSCHIAGDGYRNEQNLFLASLH